MATKRETVETYQSLENVITAKPGNAMVSTPGRSRNGAFGSGSKICAKTGRGFVKRPAF